MNLKNAAVKAVETVISYQINPSHPDPLQILQKLPNVLLIGYSINSDDPEIQPPISSGQDALTMASRKNGKLRYIILYDQSIPQERLRFALARELGHVILQHDGADPESVWSEEASCFAHHFLCPLPMTHPVSQASGPINYRPVRMSISWELKDSRVFDSIEEMKAYIVNEKNKFYHYIGSKKVCRLVDVKLEKPCDYDRFTGWKNCFDIVLNGETVGHCGE